MNVNKINEDQAFIYACKPSFLNPKISIIKYYSLKYDAT